ncbi:MAG: HypC/HybG/HupF family hydrogenase formation chaperone [Acidobacteria bacterium]|nr:MAG: HypC/HybG/HupF family hydrogenase formation chaperone [Acidobacteriota bacterium]
MCLAIPMKLLRRDEFEGTVELDGIRRSISMMLLPEAEVGQHVLVHAGYAIGTINEEEAAKTLELLREYADTMEEF